MTAEDHSARNFDLDSFNRAQDEIHRLNRHLPPSDVQSLAREVIERLAQRSVPSHATHSAQPDREIVALSLALISKEPDAAKELIMQAQRDGVSVPELYLSYLGASARRLGDWWDADQVSFVDVTVGVTRIYGIMRGLRPVWTSSRAGGRKSAIFAAVPGDDHTLGVTMATDLFRRDGWDIDLEVGLDHDALVGYLDLADYTVIGLSASGRKSLAALIRLILAIRIGNPAAFILVGGNIVAEDPDIVATTGADGAALDVPQALRIMNHLVGVGT
ncbi:MAG: cobalamin-dependent protein [Rhodobacter sp.]|nr:cobalamin-dependent protein [Rhodobacter sp.]